MKIKKITIDRDKCIGCGACAALLPSVFELDEENKSRVKGINASDEEIRQAIESCPVQAILVEE